jgi:hypothetical protein
MTAGKDTLASFMVWFGITMLQKPKRNYTLQFIKSKYNNAFMQWLSSKDKLSTNNAIILK